MAQSTKYIRRADGASVDAEQYDRSPASVHRIIDLIGQFGVNNTTHGLLIDRPYDDLSLVLIKGTWIVKATRGLRFVSETAFQQGYKKP